MRKRSLPIPFYSAARANLRPFGAPPSIGRRESRVPAPKPFPRGKEAIREYRFLRTVISSASEKSFSFAVKQCMRVNKNGKPDIPRMWDAVLHVNGLAKVSRKRQQQRSLGYARDDDTGGEIVLQKRCKRRRVTILSCVSFRAKARNLFRWRIVRRCLKCGKREACDRRPTCRLMPIRSEAASSS